MNKIYYNDATVIDKNLQIGSDNVFLPDRIISNVDENYYYYIQYFQSPYTEILDYYCRRMSNTFLTNSQQMNIINETRAKLKLPKIVLNDLKINKAKIIIDSSHEGYFQRGWDQIYKLFDVLPGDLIWITSDLFIKKTAIINYDFRFFNRWERAVLTHYDYNFMSLTAFIHFIKQDINDKSLKKYYNIYYNRRPRLNRIMLMIDLCHEKLIDDMLWSWGGFKLDEKVKFTLSPYMHEQLYKDFDSSYSDTITEVLTWDKIKTAEHNNENLDVDLAFELNLSDFYNSYYHLISETFTENKNMLLSEKTFKVILLHQPFIMWGSPYTIKTLKCFGYKTFDKWIDHSYDNIEDPNLRRKILVAEIKRLNAFTKEKWAEIKYEMLPDLEYNFANLLKANTRYNFLS